MMLGGALSTEGFIPGGAPGEAAVGGAPDGGRNNRGTGMPVIKQYKQCKFPKLICLQLLTELFCKGY